MGRTCRTHGEKMNACRILVRKLERKTSLRRPRLMWEDNTKMDLKEVKWGGMDWTELA
jgi:hypothetical protein